MTTGRIEIEATLMDAVHHGAGVSGNTQRLRTQTVIDDNGKLCRVPYVSGSSFKHSIREGMVRHALAVMEVKNGTMTKAMVDLLFSGGHLSKSGSAVDLASARKLEELFPALAVMGYSAGNTMRASKLIVDNFHLVCAENSWRIPDCVAKDLRAKMKSGSFRADEFGTRHEVTKYEFASRLLEDSERKQLEMSVSSNLKKAPAEILKGQSSQMIFEFQTIIAGSKMFSGIGFSGLSTMEMAALKSGLSTSCEGGDADFGYIYRLGGKRAVGLGRVLMRFTGTLRNLNISSSSETELSTVSVDDGYEAHLRENRDEIVDALKKAAG